MVTMPMAESTATITSPRPVSLVPRRLSSAWALGLHGTAASAFTLVAALLLGRVGPVVLTAVLAWPVLLVLLAGPTPALGTLAAHHRRAALRTVAAAALGWWILAAVASSPPPAALSLGLVVSEGLLTAAAATLTARSVHRPRALVVGDPDHLPVAIANVAVTAGRDVQVVGGCAPDELGRALQQLRPEAVLALPGPELTGRGLQRLAWQAEAERLPFLLLSGLADVAPDRTRHLSLGGLDAVEVRHPRRSGARAVAKVAWERVAAALALVATAPLLLVLAAWIRLDSPGPAFFRQTRVGRDGRAFTMLKLRTMRCDAEVVRPRLSSDVDGVLFKVRADPRVTRIGRVLRRYSLDELPQLFNVLAGQMALVGPRPALPAEVAAYDDDPRRRLVVRPGITGLWQVSGRSDLSWHETVRLDLDYVDNWSLRRDLAIVWRTVRAVLDHRGAY